VSNDRLNVRDVFTPTTPARLAFVERESINTKLVNALETPGKQVVVYGYSGSGKTTLLENKLHQAYERHLTTRCVQGLSFEQLVLDAFDQLEGFYESELTGIKKTSLSSSIGAQYATIKAQVKAQSDSEEQRKQQRILPPQLTPQTLARLLGEAGCCWVLEDFHKMESGEKVKLAQIMKVCVLHRGSRDLT
jgi:excinuclease UvrABC ATPase subunit